MKAPASHQVFLAVDLGAESGRVMAASYDGSTLKLEEVNRFANGPITHDGHLHWDIDSLYSHILDGLKRAAKTYGSQIKSIGIDTWGVDYGLLDKNDELITPPYHYRDARNDGMAEAIFKRIPAADLYTATGIQTLPFNTIFQLEAERQQNPERLTKARKLLHIPDLLAFWLTGQATSEHTIASTGQMLYPGEMRWNADLLEQLELPTHLLQTLIAPGKTLSSITKAVQDQTGLPAVPVVASAGHDTASAVAGTPGQGNHWAFLSSGTWSLLGVELQHAVTTEAAQAANFSNEAGVDGTTRFLKNIAGLYLLQECRKTWQEQDGQPIDYADLTAQAAAAPALTATFDPQDPRLVKPGKMPTRIRDVIAESGQPIPEDRATLARVILESLAYCYRAFINQLEALSDRHIDTIIVVGGGSRNHLLNQMIADATGRTVVAGPAEATALGNAAVQMIAAGTFKDLAEARLAIDQSFPGTTFTPQNTAAWDALDPA
ncbi:rhamnulokinase [Mucisphaera sp.]|uniref:rhamnulokinase n=1 Tax=Mucisphaera sp. TaxID=2913024 RepID=UPI003D0A3AE4